MRTAEQIQRRIASRRRYIESLPRRSDGKVGRGYEIGLTKARAAIEALEWVLNTSGDARDT